MAMAARKAPPACSAPSPAMTASATKAGRDSTSPPRSHRAVGFMAACSLTFPPSPLGERAGVRGRSALARPPSPSRCAGPSLSPRGEGMPLPVLLDRLVSGQRREIDEIGYRGAHLDD